MGMLRFFSTSFRYLNGSNPLSILRKKTGYSLSNIRKALELNDNDLNKAEAWLKEQAKAQGWQKLEKLQNRVAVQGLVGIAVENKKIAMVEVNCETDFVARNEKFKSLVELVAKTCLGQPLLTSGLDTNKVYFDSQKLGQLKANDTSLVDHLALLIGDLGENMALKRAVCYETSRNDIEVAANIHPPIENSFLFGQYGAFITYQRNSDSTLPENDENKNIPEKICTHIIGLNPSVIGEYGKDEPVGENERKHDPEKILIHQDFVLDESVTVGELLRENGMTILDFERFQCGELSKNSETESNSDDEQQVSTAKA